MNSQSKDHERLKARLADLTVAQRKLLSHRLGAENNSASASGLGHASMPKIPPRRVDVDAEGGSVAIYPASHGQQRMWFLHHYMPDSPVYCTPQAFHLRGTLDIPRLEAAFERVIQRHDILRTTFAMEDGALVQRVAFESAFRLERLPAPDPSMRGRRAEAEHGLEASACLPFDLSAAPPFRVVLVPVGHEEFLLLIVMHHIISDGWSLSNLCLELAASYNALAAGTPAAWPELPVQFADYSAWQRGWLQSGALQTQTAYWARKLAGQPEPLELPADHPRPALESFRGGQCALLLDERLIAALKKRAQERGATLFMLLLAAFKVLLYRYTGQTDLLLGVPIANRQRLEVEKLVGFFANTLVMRTTVSAEATFAELLDRVKETALEAYEHQDMPFEQLVELLRVRRDASRAPLFQVSFALQDYPEVRLPLTGLEVTACRVDTHTSKFDLSLMVLPGSTDWTAKVEYSADLFSPDRLQRMLEHWRTVLVGIAVDPSRRIAEIPLLTPAEQRRVLVDWNDTARDFPREKCLHELFAESARRTPEAVAATYEARQITYRELDQQSDQLAQHLQVLGVGPEVRVGLCVERSLEMLVALLAILKAGGAYVPLDPHYPPSRLALILEDAQAPLLLTQRSLLDRCAGFEGRRVLLDEWQPAQDAPVPAVKAAPTNAAYLIYTSGSTGRPKGIVIEHRSAVNLLHSMQTQPGLSAEDVLLAVTTMSFDISVVEFFLPLSVGARVVIAPESVRADGAALAALLKQSGATIFQATPATWKLLLHAGWEGDGKLKALTGGEALAPELARQILARSAELWNLYGPTETTVYSLGTRICAGDAITIGRPLANGLAYVVDQHGQPAPIGVPGELWIGGAGVAREYFGQPGLTAERFTADPFSSAPHARLYRTGDLCRWRADGTVEFLGRLDTQVKLRGFRIEPGEIETALLEVAGVREAVVVLREIPGEESMLVAYMVLEADAALDEAGLKATLRTRLPEYLVPARSEFLPALPLTPSGKVNRGTLPEPHRQTAVRRAGSEPPRNLLELNIQRLWQRIFQRDHIGRDDNFFDLGGHSLLAARVVGEVEKLIGRRVPISALFQAPTAAALARLLVEKDWAPAWSSLVPLQPAGAEVPIFCVHGRGGDVFGFLDLARELAPDRPIYGLQAAGLGGTRPLHGTIEEMAAFYAREIRALRPTGPYHLMGHSMGGWIAYAVAQELTRAGQRVALLALLDTQATADLPWPLQAWIKLSWLVQRAGVHWQNLTSDPKNWRLDHLRLRLHWLRYHLARARGPRRMPELPEGVGPGQGRDPFAAAGAQYRPAQYHGDVDLFVTGGTPRRQWSFWKHLIVGRVHIHRIAGDHLTLIDKDHARSFAGILQQALRRAEASDR